MKADSFPFHVDTQRCTGCGRCVAACAERLFTLGADGYRKCAIMISPECCDCCLKCMAECPVGAIVPGPL